MLQQSFSYPPPGDNLYIRIKRDRRKASSGKKQPITVQGRGTEINAGVLVNRAKRKTITQVMALNLVTVAERKRRPIEHIKYYWRAYHCQGEIVKAGDVMHGYYCKTRICTICNCIRKAEEINKYLPVVSEWQKPYCMVLTCQSVPAKWLKGRVDNVFRAFKILSERWKKRYQRGKGIKVMGIKSVECNFNPKRGTYNVHMHLLVNSKEVAQLIRKDWLLLWKERHASGKAQFVRPVQDTTKDLIEVIKYNTKVFTDPTGPKEERKKTPFIYLSAMDNIVYAMRGHRVFDRFGFNLPKANPKKRQEKQVSDFSKFRFKSNYNDWEDEQTGELLTGYEITEELRAILEGRLDLEIE